MISEFFEIPAHQPRVAGTGLVALDAVLGEREGHRFWAGGSCGNVLMILSYLGWRSIPISRLDNDTAGEYVVEDMKRWGVDTSLLQLEPRAETPIIIHQIGRSKEGIPYHRFSWTCPVCGNWFPGFKPIVLGAANTAVRLVKRSNVFYLDRVSPAAVWLAKTWSAKGALVFFEPSSVRDERLYKEALAIADVFKYSEERGRHLAEVTASVRPTLEIQTLGPEGLRFRTSLGGYSHKRWETLDPYAIETFKDAGGAGDWCSAGLIHALAAHGRSKFRRLSRRKLLAGINFSQALAAWSCRFEGARGGMYALSRRAFQSQVSTILSRGQTSPPSMRMRLEDEVGVFKEVCRGCQDG